MPETSVSVSNDRTTVVFLDGSDPRIPFHTEHGGSSLYEHEKSGWKIANVKVITKAETAAAKAAKAKMIKPFDGPDSTDSFFSEFQSPRRTPLWSPVFYNEEGEYNTRREMEKADILRRFYPDWATEELQNPGWYNEIPHSGVLAMASQFNEKRAETLEKIKDRPLSNGTMLKSVAAKFYDLELRARKAWMDKYNELLKAGDRPKAKRNADKAMKNVLNSANSSSGGKRKTRRR